MSDDGAGIVRGSWIGTAAFAVTAVAGVAAPGVFSWVAFTVAVTLFVAGCGVFVWAYALAVRRSRTDEIAVASLYLLSGSAPKTVRGHLLGSLAVEVAVALATAAASGVTLAPGAARAALLARVPAARYGGAIEIRPSEVYW